MFKNLDSDNDTEAGYMCSGRSFREVPLANLFKQSYKDEGFYSGEEEELTQEEYFYSGEEVGLSYEEYSEFAMEKEVETEDIF